MRGSEAEASQARIPFRAFLPLIAVGIAAAAITILVGRIQELDGALLLAHLRDYSPWLIAYALLLVFTSLALIGVYEMAMLGELGHPMSLARGLLIGGIANPVGHAVGFSTLSAGALRFRFYAARGLATRTIGGIVVLSAFPYVLGIMLLLDLALLFGARQAAPALRLSPGTVSLLGAIGLAKDIGYVLLTKFRRTPFRIGPLLVRLPTMSFTVLQLLIGVIQITCIGGVLYLFMPPELGMGFAAFLVVYLISLAAGSVSNVPAGIGVLEAALLLMLPQVPPEKLLAAVLAYRGIYELLPLVISLLMLGAYEFASRHGIAGRLWRT
jgi:uncharacterized membrane protein YbhN (UPF0104 family)